MTFKTLNLITMKKNLLLNLAALLLLFSCAENTSSGVNATNELYEKNLVTAKKFFELFSSEDTEAQKPLICPGVTHYSPFIGSEGSKYDEFLANNKQWMDNFDDITYTPTSWTPGADADGKSNGEVKTYGTWTAKSVATGNEITVRAHHYFTFNGSGQIHEIGDFFDATGVMAQAMATK